MRGESVAEATFEAWRELAPAATWVEYEAEELQRFDITCAWSKGEELVRQLVELHDRHLQSPTSVQRSTLSVDVERHLLKELGDAVRPDCVRYRWSQRRMAWRHEIRPSHDGDMVVIDVSTPVVSVSVCTPQGDWLASLTGPMRDQESFLCARAEWMFLDTGWDLVVRDADAGIGAFKTMASFCLALEARGKTVSRSIDAQVGEDPQARVAGEVTHEAKSAYLPTKAVLRHTRGGAPTRLRVVCMAYDPKTLPIPRSVLTIRMDRRDPSATDARLSVGAFDIWDVHFPPATDRDLRIQLPLTASIEDRSTSRIFHGNASEPQRWPVHWYAAFVTATGGTGTPTSAGMGPAVFLPREALGRHNPWVPRLLGIVLAAAGVTTLLVRGVRRRLRTAGVQ